MKNILEKLPDLLFFILVLIGGICISLSNLKIKIINCQMTSIGNTDEQYNRAWKVCSNDYECFSNYLDGLQYKKLDKCLNSIRK